jgi:hypothetical protein
MTALLALGAISIDAGKLFAEKQRLVNVADAAALAGAQYLPGDESLAIATALDYAELNGIPRERTTAEIVDAAKRRIRVTVQRDVDLAFARIIHIQQESVMAGANAVRGPVGKVRGAVPLGVELPEGIRFGEELVLKEGGGEGAFGNYHALSFGGRGASEFADNVRNGYDGWISVGQTIDTEPGNMAGPTRGAIRDRIFADPYATVDTVASDSPRLIVVPIVSFDEASGRDRVTVLGFACFFVKQMVGNDTVVGQFVRILKPGEIIESETATDYGVDVVKLTR